MARWLILLYRLPREPSGPRMAVWRALQRIEGGAILQDGVFVVRHAKLHEVTLADLAHDIKNAEGEATIATSSVDDEAHLLARLASGAKPAAAPPAAKRARPPRRRRR